MRSILALLMVFASVNLLAPEADARKATRAEKSYSKSYGYAKSRRGPNTASDYYRSPETDSMECIRARDVDPAGNYAGYPCWAQYALSPKRRGS
jgi:hypothetical protein